MNLFPALDRREVLTETRQRWDLSGPLPVPEDGWLACPVCRHEIVQARFWRYHRRPDNPTVTGRCDLSFKCTSCAAVWTHGVAVDEDTWTRTARRIGRNIGWREAQQIFDDG